MPKEQTVHDMIARNFMTGQSMKLHTRDHPTHVVKAPTKMVITAQMVPCTSAKFCMIRTSQPIAVSHINTLINKAGICHSSFEWKSGKLRVLSYPPYIKKYSMAIEMLSITIKIRVIVGFFMVNNV